MIYNSKTPKPIVFIIVLLVVTSCAANQASSTETPHTAQTTHTLNPSPFQEQIVCPHVNCWAGIIPGSTTLTEAQDLLEAEYGERNFSMGEHFFSWSTNSSRSSPGGIVIASASATVNTIIVNLFEHQLTVDEMLTWIGIPTFVQVTRSISSEFQCTSSLIAYPTIGVNAALYPQNDSSVGVSSTQSVSGLIFFARDNIVDSTQPDTFTLEWQGYTNYCDLVSLTATP